mmetsp:Transcript_23295/g.31139  ORF Transcript_23295/g.31139 Transcript_23295/m.31139 type:complete len:118 (-) Transcript_23295:1554-1907(-)
MIDLSLDVFLQVFEYLIRLLFFALAGASRGALRRFFTPALSAHPTSLPLAVLGRFTSNIALPILLEVHIFEQTRENGHLRQQRVARVVEHSQRALLPRHFTLHAFANIETFARNVCL